MLFEPTACLRCGAQVVTTCTWRKDEGFFKHFSCSERCGWQEKHEAQDWDGSKEEMMEEFADIWDMDPHQDEDTFIHQMEECFKDTYDELQMEKRGPVAQCTQCPLTIYAPAEALMGLDDQCPVCGGEVKRL